MSTNKNPHSDGENLIPDDGTKTKDPPQHEEDEGSTIADLFHVLGIKKKGSVSSFISKEELESSPLNNDEVVDLSDSTEQPSELVSDDNTAHCKSEHSDETYTKNLLDISYTYESQLDNKGEAPLKKNKTLKKVVFTLLLAMCIVLARFAPLLFEPKPPSPDVVVSYNGKYITTEQLQAFIVLEQAREQEHIICPTHGYDHSKCTPDEECESHPIDSFEGYQSMVTRLAVEQMIQEWADEKGITQREDVQHSMKDLLNNVTVEQYVARLHDENITAESIPIWEIQQYYEENQDTYIGKPLSEVEDDIRKILAMKKDEDFFPQYIEELKKTAGLQVNFDILKVTEPTNDEILSYYETNATDYQTKDTAKYSEILINNDDYMNSATDAVRKIRSGESFENVAASFSKDGKSSMKTLVKGTGDAALETLLWKMNIGDISDPITNADGSASIVMLTEINKAGVKPFDSVKSEIRNILLTKNMEAEYTLRKSEMLFSIHSRRYTLGEFYTEFKELSEIYQLEFSSFETKKQLVEQMIAQELLLEQSSDKSSNEQEEHSYEEMKIQYLAQILHQDEVDEKLTEPTEEEIRDFYEKNKKDLIIPATVQLNLIWISQGENSEKKEQAFQKAKEALSAINNGMSFAEAAKQYSEDPSADYGGQLQGDLYKEYLVPPLAEAAFSLEINKVSDVLEYSDGYFILQVRSRTEEQVQSYDQAAEGIKSHLSEQQHVQLEMNMEKTMLENANFTIYNKTIRRLIKENKDNI